MLRKMIYVLRRDRFYEKEEWKDRESAGMRIALNVLKETYLGAELPVPVVEISRLSGWFISESTFYNGRSFLGNINEGSRVIEASWNATDEEKRWVIAKSLGHGLMHMDEDEEGRLVLHPNVSKVTLLKPLGYYRNPYEAAAEAFAAMLLLPEDIWKKKKRWSNVRWSYEARVPVWVVGYRRDLYERRGF